MTIENVLLHLIVSFSLNVCVLSFILFLLLRFLPSSHAVDRHNVSAIIFFASPLLFAVPYLPEMHIINSFGAHLESLSPILTTLAQPSISFFQDGSLSPTLREANQLNSIWLLCSIWLAGTVFFLIRLTLAVLGSRQWLSHARPCNVSSLNLSAPITVKYSCFVGSPMVLGFRSPIVLVPHDFYSDQLDDLTRRVMLEHEIAHIKRADIWTNFIQKLILALFWWAWPLHWVHSRIIVEREKICDNIAARTCGMGSEPAQALAQALVDLASKSMTPKPSNAVAVSMTSKTSDLSERVRQLLCDSGNKALKPRRTRFASVLLVSFLLSGVIMAAPRIHSSPLGVSPERQAADRSFAQEITSLLLSDGYISDVTASIEITHSNYRLQLNRNTIPLNREEEYCKLFYKYNIPTPDNLNVRISQKTIAVSYNTEKAQSVARVTSLS